MADESHAPNESEDGRDPDDDAQALAARLSRLEADVARGLAPTPWPRRAAYAGVLAALVAAGGYFAFERWTEHRIQEAALAAIDAVPGQGGYRVDVNVDATRLSARGLAPTDAVRQGVKQALTAVAEAEGRALELVIDLPPTAASHSPEAVAAALKPQLRTEFAPLSGAVADAAHRVQALEDALAAAATRAAAQDAEIAALKASAADAAAASAAKAVAATAALTALADKLEARLAAAERQAAILSAEIVASERVMERRNDRANAAQGVILESLREKVAETAAANARRAEALEAEAKTAVAALENALAAARDNERRTAERLETAIAAAKAAGETQLAAVVNAAAAARTAASDRIDALAAELAAAQAASADLAQSDAAVAKRLAAIETEISGLTQLATAADAERTAGSKRLAKTAARLNEIDDALTASAKERKGVKARLGAAEERLSAVAQSQNAEAQERADDKDRLAQAENRLGVLSTTLAALAKEEDGKTSLLAEAKAGLTGLSQAVEAARAAAAAEIARLTASHDALAARLEGFDAASVDTLKRLAAGQEAGEAAMAALANRIDDVRRDLTAFESGLTVANGRIASAAADARKLANVAGDFETLSGEVRAFEKELSARSATVDQIQTDLSAWQVQLAASAAAAAKFEASAEAGDKPPRLRPPSLPNAAYEKRMDELEARAAEAIALLDRRIDRIAQEAQPRAASHLDVVQRQLAPLRIRFASLAQPASRDAANDTLKRVAEIALAMPKDMRIRVIGYADSDGTVDANRITSKRRSDWTVEELKRIGVPPERIVSVGRGAEQLLSPDASDDSPNRRVEFEAF